jgi:hypothetical protein
MNGLGFTSLKERTYWPIWIIPLDMSIECQGEPMQIS